MRWQTVKDKDFLEYTGNRDQRVKVRRYRTFNSVITVYRTERPAALWTLTPNQFAPIADLPEDEIDRIAQAMVDDAIDSF